MSWITVHGLVRESDQSVEYLRFWTSTEDEEYCIRQYVTSAGESLTLQRLPLLTAVAELTEAGWVEYSKLDLLVPDFVEKAASLGRVRGAVADLNDYLNEVWYGRYGFRIPRVEDVQRELRVIEAGLR